MKSYKFVFYLFLAFFVFSCADLDELEPVNEIPSDVAINNLQSSEAALAGMYDMMQDNGLIFDGWLALAQFFSDEANATGTFPTRLEFGNLNVFPANSTAAGVFSDLYEVINRANNIIDIVPTITDDAALTDEIKADFVAQAKFVRAHAYLHLTTLWRDVPLILTPTKSDELDGINVPKNTQAEIYAQVVKDFSDARSALLETSNEKANATAATAFLARVNLYQENWAEALSLAKEVLGDGFDLTAIPYLQDVIYKLGFSTSDGNTLNFFYGSSDQGGRYSIGPSLELIAAFEPGDLRFAQTLDTSSWSVPIGMKYPSFDQGISGAATDPIYFIRHAEMVLIAAEAAAEMGDFATASMFFNQVRARAGLDPVTLDASNFVDAILHERFTEFAFEGAFRLIDLRRKGKALEVLGPIGYDECDDVWPLPQRDIDRNVNLKQNDCCNC
ncbi:MAG TPA: RagB/SusD family nutrient uptake outer membrane protein [Bacteroidetes bacterium]|nr:RagB/SusD family nutrient uptake outer membrane protein [Bacteroidota bacterium]